MAFYKSKFLTLFLLFCTLHLAFANEEFVVDDSIAKTEIVGQRLPYAQDCCNYAHNGNCVAPPNCCSSGGDYCTVPPCVQNPSNRCWVPPACQPSPPSCPWQGPCPSCNCVRSNGKVETQHESDHPTTESMPPHH